MYLFVVYVMGPQIWQHSASHPTLGVNQCLPSCDAVDSLKCFVNMTKEQRTFDKNFLTEKKELEFFILYVCFITCNSAILFNKLEVVLFIIGDCTGV